MVISSYEEYNEEDEDMEIDRKDPNIQREKNISPSPTTQIKNRRRLYHELPLGRVIFFSKETPLEPL